MVSSSIEDVLSRVSEDASNARSDYLALCVSACHSPVPGVLGCTVADVDGRFKFVVQDR
jgi:hypothetical protein